MGRDRDKFRKFESGNDKLKKKIKREKFLKSQRDAFEKFLQPLDIGNGDNNEFESKDCCSSGSTESTNRPREIIIREITDGSTGTTEIFTQKMITDDVSKNTSDISNKDDSFDILVVKTHSGSDDTTSETLAKLSMEDIISDLIDPGMWPDVIPTFHFDEIIKKGPLQTVNFNFPINEDKRHFSSDLYNRTLPNGEKIIRRWLVYSKSKNSVFCFCCKLFKNIFGGKLAAEGFSDWRHLSTRLQSHEQSVEHAESVQKWIECELRLKKEMTIDEKHKNLIEKEREHWRLVLKRIIQVIKFLAAHNIAFRGSSSKLYQSNNGIFLGLIEMIATFDPTMQEHIRRIKSSEIHDHYLGARIQNELIQLMSEKVREKIVSDIKATKYFSIILDCTPDINHQEQMSMIIRYVKIESNGVENDSEGIYVEEHFISFLNVKSTTGKNLTDILLEELDGMGLNIKDCRGQGYDNGSSMKGIHCGVQARILQINPKAFYMPCASHSLNLIICDAAKCTPKAMTFFGEVQRIYVIFSASTKRWDILKKNVPNLTVKKSCDTRWESKIESVRALRYQIKEIRDALIEVIEITDDVKVKSETRSLLNVVSSYEFLLALAIWHDLLFAANTVSKNLQSEKMHLGVASELLDGLLNFLEQYRNEGFVSATLVAKEMSESLDVKPKFQEVRQRKKRKLFDYEGEDEPVSGSAEEVFKVDYFYRIVDCTIQSISSRFQQMASYNTMFGFLYDLKEMKRINDKELIQKCKDLEKVLNLEEDKDICGNELFTELKVLRNLLPAKVETAAGVLRFMNRIQNPFPNAFIAYRILLTIPVTVASAERSFSRLKLIKTYLRSSMSQERLSSLALLSIEADTTGKINFEDLIDDFARLKARKVNFL